MATWYYIDKFMSLESKFEIFASLIFWGMWGELEEVRRWRMIWESILKISLSFFPGIFYLFTYFLFISLDKFSHFIPVSIVPKSLDLTRDLSLLTLLHMRCFSKCGLWTSSMDSTWKLVRNEDSQVPPETLYQNQHFSKISNWFVCILKYWQYWFVVMVSTW